MTLTPLPDVLVLPLVEAALREDLGRAGDITTDAIVPETLKGRASFVARNPGVIAGLDMARLALHAVDSKLAFAALKRDGDEVAPGDCLATVEGSMRSILTAERVALNFLCHLSGIATETRKLVDAIKTSKAVISCTRKTTPGLRLVEKYAVRSGGGSNHRFGLDDAILIKDNHIAAAGGIRPALERARKAAGHLVKIELEVDTLEQLDEALSLLPEHPLEVVLLDNMPPPMLKQAVSKVAGRLKTEASGNVNLQTVVSIAATGVDIISVGAITHSAPILDIGLDIA
ncbi:MAG: carboxylating nicotinate-nucleotide diphosphorylase [Alphaproteobacteria bacterium]|nr:carboxylating nicotinate-nucleotide diphosphorylase [Alphaproteobacteria bacterium]